MSTFFEVVLASSSKVIMSIWKIMKLLLTFSLAFLFSSPLHAEDILGEQKYVDIKSENTKLQAQLLCKYLKKNPFINVVNGNSSWGHAQTKKSEKSPSAVYLKASKAADKAIHSSCSSEELFSGNILSDVWNTFFESCTVKNKECMAHASRYMENAELVNNSIFESLNLVKKEVSSGDCLGTVNNSGRHSNKAGLLDKELKKDPKGGEASFQ